MAQSTGMHSLSGSYSNTVQYITIGIYCCCVSVLFSIVTCMVNASAVGMVIFGICVEGDRMSHGLGPLFIH